MIAKSFQSDQWAIAKRRVEFVLFVIVLLVGLAIRGSDLSIRSFWYDEAFSWRVIQFPFWEMIQRVGRDNHPPLYFILLKEWAALFGDSPAGLRSLSVALGGLTMVGVYLFCSEAFRSDSSGERGRRIGTIAAALIALSAFQIRYAWEARMYTLATALAALSSWALFRALRKPAEHRRWVVYAFLALLLVYTHYYGLFTIAAQILFLAGYLLLQTNWNIRTVFRSFAFWNALLAITIILVGWLPWMPVFLRQRSQVQEMFWAPAATPQRFAGLCYRMMFDPENQTPPLQCYWLWVAAFCVLAVWALRHKGRAGDWYVFLATVAPIIFSILVSAYDTKIFALRYFIMAHFFFLTGLSVLVFRVSHFLERTILIVLLLGSSFFVYLVFLTSMDADHKGGSRAAAAYIDSQRVPGEPVIVSMPQFYFPMLYHASNRRDYYLYTDGSPIVHYSGTAVLAAEELINDEQLRSIRSGRVWIVDMGGGYWGTHFTPVPLSWRQIDRRAFHEVFGMGDVIVIQYATPKSLAALPSAIKP